MWRWCLLGTLSQFGCSLLFTAPCELGWSRTSGGPGPDAAKALVAGPDDCSVIACGGFEGGLSFGQGDVITSLGSHDGFVVRFDATGDARWLRGFGGTGSDGCDALAVDERGHVFAAGFFTGTALAGDLEVSAVTGEDGLVVAYSPEGDVLWVTTFGTPGADRALAVVAGGGRLFVGGSAESDEAISTSSGAALLEGSGEAVLLELSPDSGEVLWGARLGGANRRSAVHALALASDGALYAAGTLNTSEESAPVDGCTFTPRATSHNGDAFLAQFDPTGVEERCVTLGSLRGPGLSAVRAVAVTDDGRLFAAGELREGLPDFPMTSGLEPRGGSDAFVARFSNEGDSLTPIWVRREGGPGDDSFRALALAADGDVLAAGSSSSTPDGPAVFGGVELVTVEHSPDLVVARYDQQGGFADLLRGGGPGEDALHAIAVGSNREIMVAGEFSACWALPSSLEIESAGGTDIVIGAVPELLSDPARTSVCAGLADPAGFDGPKRAR